MGTLICIIVTIVLGGIWLYISCKNAKEIEFPDMVDEQIMFIFRGENYKGRVVAQDGDLIIIEGNHDKNMYVRSIFEIYKLNTEN